MSERIGTKRYSPAGQWVIATVLESVVGIQHRRGEVAEFVDAVRWSDANGQRYGVRPVRDVDNQNDENAIAVLGFGCVKRMSGIEPAVWHIGYLRREAAADVVSDIIERGLPIEGELYEIHVGDDDSCDVKLFVLAPPGNSLSTRQRRFKRAGLVPP